jgi:hypothetical protein
MTGDGFLTEEANRQRKPDREDSANADAIHFLKEQLASGPVLTKELMETARENGIKPRTLERAMPQAGVKARKREDGKWEKYLDSTSMADMADMAALDTNADGFWT